MSAADRLNALAEEVCMAAMEKLDGLTEPELTEAASIFWAVPTCMIVGWGSHLGQIKSHEVSDLMFSGEFEFPSFTAGELGLVMDEDDLDASEAMASQLLRTKIRLFWNIYRDSADNRMGVMAFTRSLSELDPFLSFRLLSDDLDSQHRSLFRSLLVCGEATFDLMKQASANMANG